MVLGPQAVLDLRDGGKQESVKVGDDRRRSARGFASARTPDGRGSPMNSASTRSAPRRTMARMRCRFAAEQAAVEEGGVGYVQDVLEGGVERGLKGRLVADRLVAPIFEEREAKRLAARARSSPLAQTQT